MERQLQELIEYCQAENVILYGVSFGAAIVAKYASNNPDNISFIGYQVPLIDSANVPLLSLIKIPLYGDLLSRALFIPTVLKRIKDYEHLMSKKLMDHYLDQFKVKGTEKFFKEFFIGNAMGNRMDNHDVIGNNDIPSYFAYAEDDLEIDSLLVKQAIGKYNNPIVKKYLGGHFFSSGIEKQVAKDFIDSIEKY
jgi:pimeloyl-ACP methyl ester carboxylesterase